MPAPGTLKERIARLTTRSHSWFGFRQLNTNYKVANLQSSDFEQILENTDAWDKLCVQMDAYFGDSVEIFPGDGDKEEISSAASDIKKNEQVAPAQSVKKVTWYQILERTMAGLARPSRFFQIQTEMIERRFPGGWGREPGDADVRDILSSLRHVFARNLLSLLIQKRVATATSVLLMLFVLRSSLTYHASASKVICGAAQGGLSCEEFSVINYCLSYFIMAALLTVVALAFLGYNNLLAAFYTNSLKESCLVANNQTAIRTKQLSNLVDEIFPKIDKDRATLDNAKRLFEWPQRSERLSILVYWLAKRLEYVERFVQIETWRMRRIHYWLYRFGRWIAYAIVVAAIGATILLNPSTIDGAYLVKDKLSAKMVQNSVLIGLDWSLWLYCLVLVTVISISSFATWNSPLELVEQTLQPDNWNRSSSVGLHNKIAKQVFRDKQNILRVEQLLGRQGS